MPKRYIYEIEYFTGYGSFPIGCIESILPKVEFQKLAENWENEPDVYGEFPDISEVLEAVKKVDPAACLYNEPEKILIMI